MNQTLVCGIGNVYKSEVLFLERVEPFIAVESLTTEELRRILVRARKLLRKNVGEVRRRTRHRADGRRHWVYGRGGQPCYECGETILLRRQGDLGRATYWCAACQRDKDRPPAQRMTSVVRTPDV